MFLKVDCEIFCLFFFFFFLTFAICNLIVKFNYVVLRNESPLQVSNSRSWNFLLDFLLMFCLSCDSAWFEIGFMSGSPLLSIFGRDHRLVRLRNEWTARFRVRYLFTSLTWSPPSRPQSTFRNTRDSIPSSRTLTNSLFLDEFEPMTAHASLRLALVNPHVVDDDGVFFANAPDKSLVPPWRNQIWLILSSNTAF